VNEVDLSTGAAVTGSAVWTCPSKFQFRIVRREDVNAIGANCTMAPDPAMPSADLLLVRNTLKVEDWYVDMTHKCIIPKQTFAQSGQSCYGQSTSIAYTMGDACDPDGPITSGSATSPTCVAFASVCTSNAN
jgi:hypothetical protein